MDKKRKVIFILFMAFMLFIVFVMMFIVMIAIGTIMFVPTVAMIMNPVIERVIIC